MSSPTETSKHQPGFMEELGRCWHQLPDKFLFFALVTAWLILFQFLGNSTFGYVDTPSLFGWMLEAYTKKSVVADDEHGLLIPFVVLALFWWKREKLLAIPARTWWPGLVIILGALAVHLLGYLVQQPRLSIVALFLGLYGIMGLTWGPAWLRASFFPFFLFAFCMPMGSLTESVTFPLRLMVSKLVAFIGQHLLGIDVMCEGTRLFKMPDQFEYEVAAACSGIRSLTAITAIAIIYGFVSFSSYGKRMLLIACSLPLAVIGNTFRVLAIVVVAEWFGQNAGMKVHDSSIGSLVPYIPAIGGLILLGRWLEGKGTAPRSESPGPVQPQITP